MLVARSLFSPLWQQKQSSDDRPDALKIPARNGAESTLAESVCSPFHAEPRTGSPERTLERSCPRCGLRSLQVPVDHQNRPQSLINLVDAGYMKQLPVDPLLLAGATRGWPELSGDQNNPGIADVHSGATTSQRGQLRD